jgi:UDP-N-acetylglucosamine--N-acetylmuramyl-(pentapeptide) pyrophosphoryl-undecaprenol N-acetylglucosamine transferase
MSDKNLLITGGGTGGHLYPAMAVIEHIQREYPGASITFIGSRKGSGKKLISEMGIEFFTVRARGFPGSGSILKKAAGYLKFLIDLLPGFFRALAILKRKRIDMVLGMGGYICAPVLLAAMARGTGFALHEQNYIPGRLNRLFSGRARYIFTSFEDTRKLLGKKADNIIYSGNPVRVTVKKSRELAPDYKNWGLSEERFTITAFGGSLGARKINESILDLQKKIGAGNDIQILLISGERFYDSIKSYLKKVEENENIPVKVYPYIHEIEKIYRITDLVIARAGANTVFETAAAGIPSILIPYPFAIDDHQSYNARYLEQQGMSILIEEKDLDPGLLAEKINMMLKDDRKIYNRMKDAHPAMSSLDSAGIISKKLMEDIIENR